MKKFNRYNMPVWFRNLRNILQQFIIPFCIFQGIRTFFFPTTVDLIFLMILAGIAAAIYYEVI